MHTIKDAIHQDIELDAFELSIIDTPLMQRLRRITQMGFAYLVYPSARHTRFEHSLGTMYLAGALSRNLGFDEKTTRELRLAGLLHDIGHMPYSHNTWIDDHIEEMLGVSHMDLSTGYVKKYYSEKIENEGLSVRRITDCIKGKGRYGSIFSSGIDIDKMDYLVRDAYFAGAAYGLIDVSRLLLTADFRNTLCFRKKGLRNIESIIISRFMMYSTVYFHKTIEIAGAMFGRAVTEAFRSGFIAEKDYISMDDCDIITLLRKNNSPLMAALDNRHLYKLGMTLNYGDLSDALIEKCTSMKNADVESIEREMESRLNLPQNALIINILPKKSLEPIYILDEGKLVNLGDISEFSWSVMNQEWHSWHIQFLCPEKHRGKLKDAGRIFLSLI